jgi:hypothetical protein
MSSFCVEVLKEFLHPEYTNEVLFESARTLALRTAGGRVLQCTAACSLEVRADIYDLRKRGRVYCLAPDG